MSQKTATKLDYMLARFMSSMINLASDMWEWGELTQEEFVALTTTLAGQLEPLSIAVRANGALQKFIEQAPHSEAVKNADLLSGPALHAFVSLVSDDTDRHQESEEADDDKNDARHALKSLGEDRVGGYLIMWGDENSKDIAGQWFTPDTAEVGAIFDAMNKLPVFYHHGGGDATKASVVGHIDSLNFDDVGVWAEAELFKSQRYHAAIKMLVKKGALGWSSGTLPLAREVKSSGEIARWPIAEGSLTPTPAEYRMIDRPIEAIKAAFEELGLDLPSDLTGSDEEQVSEKDIEIERERLALLE